MATINFYLIHRDKTEEKKIKVKYLDKSSKTGKTSFQHSLPFTANPEKWDHRIDKKTKQEKWLIEDTEEAIKINGALRDYKRKIFLLRDALTIKKNKYGNKEYPISDQIEKAYRDRLGKDKLLQFDESKIKQQINSLNVEELDELHREVHIVNYEKMERIDPAEFRNNLPKIEDTTIIDLINRYIKDRGKDGDISDGTVRILENTASRTLDFQNKEGIRITLDTLSKNLFNSLKNFLLTPKEEGGAGLQNATTKKHLGQIKTVMNNYEEDYPHMNRGFLKGKLPKAKKEIVFTMYEELDILKEMDFKKIILDKYLSRFRNAHENNESFWNSSELGEIMKVTRDTVSNLVKRYGFPREDDKVSGTKKHKYDKQKVVNWVIDNEWCDNMESLEDRVKGYNEVRDWYCFASEAPLRYSDLVSLNPKISIFNGFDQSGKPIKVVRHYPVKTIRDEVLQQFTLTDYCISILEKYKDKVLENQFLPIRHSNTQLNKILHKMFQLSGLFDDEVTVKKRIGTRVDPYKSPRWKELSFHTTRHTYGTNKAMVELNPLKIMTGLGHTDFRTTQIYIEVVGDDYCSPIVNKYKNKNKKSQAKVFNMDGSEGSVNHFKRKVSN